ncbi:MAG: hypothetical protein JNJ46_10840 [Myxococcales bacterium]|jgi:hypothetical protein|nr:hypothetical protein [Myxococcales bacterium]
MSQPAGPPVPPENADAIVERTIAITRTLREVAHALMERAFAAREAGELDLQGFLSVSDRYQAMINQANTALYEVVKTLPPLGSHIQTIERATHELQAVAKRLRDVTDVVTISAELLVALSALTVAVLRPDAAAVAATAEAIAAVTESIRARIIRR